LFSNAINNQTTNGQKDDQTQETFKICAVFVQAQLPIWYMLIRQVAALRHVKN